ncbi:MAG: class I SAM-dependent methyltransferase, partial [Gammaproteobacteria bacterium]|nr:class I SAM-dependent methyltransferase [Gammaproteobacteria bacterium]
AGLNERYVREWLGAMTTGGVVEADGQGKFHLPREHAAILTRENAADNAAVFAQYIPQLGYVEDDIVECFKNGGGVPYEKFPRFHEIMAEDSGQSVLSCLESHLIPLVPGLHDRLTKGIKVLDAGCGRGKALNKLAKLYPASDFVGYDLSEQAIAFAKNEAWDKSITNVQFEVRDLSDFDKTAEHGVFDLITTFDAVHDQGKPRNLLKGIFNSLKEDGVYLMQDIHGSRHAHNNLDHPIGTLLYTISCLHCMTVSLAQGGEGLGAMWGEETAQEYLREAGFKGIEIRRLDHDLQNNYYIVRKRAAQVAAA